MKKMKSEFLLISPNISYTVLVNEYAQPVVQTLKIKI